MREKVSVLMSVYNENLDWLKDAVESIINQTYINFEFLIIVDNPFNFENINYLKGWALKDSRVRVVINEQNIGLAESLNKALILSEGDFIARIDADDIADKKRLERQLNKFKEQPTIDFISGNVDIIDEDGYLVRKARTKEYNIGKLIKILPVVNVLVHPTWMIRRDVYEKLQGYRKFPAAEDYDFALRAIDSNVKILHMKEKLGQYRIRNTSMGYDTALISQVVSKYIVELHKKRKNEGLDSYDIEHLNRLLLIPEEEQKKYSKYIVELKIKNRGNFMKMLITIFKASVNSKYFRREFINMLYVQFTLRVY
ncbi:hypothetical protein A5819_001981 [Enterococcus sp. 7E2_DIV0204]|uniref:glycosyltransferase n=1 Tax=unclassified Enterococcus TaxID=2608891 RepID=UPI000A32EBCF|nr:MULTISPECIES: glycosyltransferase [unclassified Enterococcus]OTN89489.1 hypothetical protein A5819_001981 [Enterococcus sp. 7E2_DIV0204]OTP51943.1 hypothetical protein A5884_001138 [Enterococcus sp. 7D2_DIV0200]